jgi:uncharacterized protein (TIGR02118 family)
MPLVERISGPTGMQAAKVIGTSEGGVPPYYRIFEFWFESPQRMQEALESEEDQEAVADLANFAMRGATTLIVRFEASVFDRMVRSGNFRYCTF